MSSRQHRLALTAHIATAVGWLGAAAAFLGLAVVGLTSSDAHTVRGAYLVMEPAAWFVLVPLALASLLTGFIMSLGTNWGLVRHYWVLYKLVINVFATAVLLIYMETFSFMAGTAADPNTDLEMVRNASPLLHALLAVLLLTMATVLAVYKPRGLTRYGWRKLHERRQASHPASPSDVVLPNEAGLRTPDLPSDADLSSERGGQSARRSPTGKRWQLYVLLGAIVVLLMILLHLMAGGIPRH